MNLLAEHELYYRDRAVDFEVCGNYRALTLALASPINKLCYIGFNHSTAGEVRQYLVQGLTMDEIAFKFAIPVEELERHLADYPASYQQQQKVRISYEEAAQIVAVRDSEHLTYQQAADRFGYSKTSLRFYLKKFGLWKPELSIYRNELTLEQAQEAVAKHKAGTSYVRLSAEYDCTRKIFRKHMVGYGLYEEQMPPVRLTLEQAQEIMRKWEAGQSFQQQAAELHMGRNTLIDALVGHGLYTKRPKPLKARGGK